MKHEWLKSQPIETYLLAILFAFSLFALLFLTLVPNDTLSYSILYYAFFGWKFLSLGLAFLYTYLNIKIYQYFKTSYSKNSTHSESFGTNVKKTSYLLGVFTLFIVFNALTVNQIFRLPPSEIAIASQWVMNLDKQVFGAYVPFAIQSLPTPEIISTIIIETYLSITKVMSALFIALLLFNRVLFRKFLLAFVFIPMICLPIWFAVPAISPNEMFRLNLLEKDISPAIQAELLPVQPQVAQFLEDVRPFKSKPDKGSYSATAFPSMHIAWGMIITIFGILLWRPLALFLIPWMGVNIIATLYTLQHYAIDIPAGMAMALLSVYIINKAIAYEKHYLTKGADPYEVIDILQADVKRALETISKVPSKIRAYVRK